MIAKFSIIAAVCGTCLAADSQIGGPTLGFVYDQKVAAVRPILGIPGASFFGEPLASELKQAVISPSQAFAISISGDDDTVGILSLSAGTRTPLPGAHRAPTKIALSPRGTSAVLGNRGHVQVFSGLPATPSIAAEFDLSDSPYSLAVSDDGTSVPEGRNQLPIEPMNGTSASPPPAISART